MKHGIFTLTSKAIENGYDWDKAIYENEIEFVEEFETYEEAVEAFNDRYIDSDTYGIA